MSQLSILINSLQNPLIELEKDTNALEHIEALISEGSLHHSPLWAGHMSPAIDTPSVLGQLLAGAHNGNLLSPELYPQLVAIEKQLINWFCELFGQSEGHFTHGSSYANLEALWQARDTASNTSKVVYGSEAVHYSIIKACQILGLKFQAIATDEQGKIDIGALSQACQHQAPTAIIATAGTTSSGAVDPLVACIKIAEEFNSWCHVDAAWGGALLLLPEQTVLLGIEQADSVCFDPHKALGQPRPCSIILYKQSLPLLGEIDADYLKHPPQKTLAGSYGGELFLPLWCTLLKGKEVLLSQLTRRLEQAEMFHHALSKQTNWQMFHSPSGIVCFKPPSTIDLTLLEEQGLLSRSKIKGEAVWRVVFASSKTRAEDLIMALGPYF
ncbi:MAG: aminotransferase class V-fold PLP-dependent enzyme [Gammaproteobacteria bacterium]|nr:aminotransferase class V-fold PLP-dependent enzyme [Gammaproteobacteria bacterium]